MELDFLVNVFYVDLMGAADDEKRKLGNWADGGSMVNNYESCIPRQAIHNIAGFKKDETYYLPRASITPCQELLDLVFPSLNSLLDSDGCL